MAFPTAVNSQITDSVSGEEARNAKNATSETNDMVDKTQEESTANMKQNTDKAVDAQTALDEELNTLLSIDTATTAVGTAKTFQK